MYISMYTDITHMYTYIYIYIHTYIRVLLQGPGAVALGRAPARLNAVID